MIGTESMCLQICRKSLGWEVESVISRESPLSSTFSAPGVSYGQGLSNGICIFFESVFHYQLIHPIFLSISLPL